jgi:hypothetical protein
MDGALVGAGCSLWPCDKVSGQVLLRKSRKGTIFCNMYTIHLLWRFDVVVVVALAANAAFVLFVLAALLLSAVLSAVCTAPQNTAQNRQKGGQTPSINPY